MWYARGTLLGKSVFVSTKTDDRKKAARVAATIRRCVLATGARHTFEEACASYVEYGGQRTYLPKLIALFGRKLLADFHQTDIDAAARLLYPKVSRETLNRQVYTPFIAVWNFAVGNEWAAARTWRRPRKPKGTARRVEVTRSGTRPVSYSRGWQFVSAMSPAPAMVMTMLFYTGMRPIELFALECDDVDVQERWIVVQSSKTGLSRGVPMHEVLVPMLTALKARGGGRDGKQVFLTRHGKKYPVTDDEVKGQLAGAINGARGRLASQRTPIDDVSPYTARHTVSTQLVMEGVHPHIKDQILGHAADDMSRHYTHVPQKPLIEAINTLPVIDAWRDAEWLNDPVTWQSKLVRWENYGRAGKPKADL